MTPTAGDRITKTAGVCGGKACIAGHRVRVLDIVIMHEHKGLSPDEITTRFPSITLGDVHAALVYYFDHLGEIQDEIRVERTRTVEARRKSTSLLGANAIEPPLEEAS